MLRFDCKCVQFHKHDPNPKREHEGLGRLLALKVRCAAAESRMVI